MEDVTVIVSTFGEDDDYLDWAAERAVPSAMKQGVKVLRSHAGSLAEARNAGMDAVKTKWLVHLDADDELEPHYLDHMLNAPPADVIAPSVRYIRASGTPSVPYIPNVSGHQCQPCSADCFKDGNWIVIGALVNAEKAARFDPAFEFYEDWDFWLTMWEAGCSFGVAPRAVYRAHMRRDSRNRARSRAEKEAMHWKIHGKHFGSTDVG